MVFYFTGTGNSLQAARAVRGEGEALYNITDCLRDGRFFFEPAADEAVGFVFPVYFGGLPTVVADFVDKLLLARPAAYCYAVPTCGGSPAAAAELLAKKLHARGVILHAAFPVTMPDNYVLMFRVPEGEALERQLSDAAAALEAVREKVARRERSGLHVTVRDRLLTAGMYPGYLRGRRTAKFFSDETCVGCGVCARRCPVGAIQMVDGRPKWIKARCTQCMACLRCNAVQYGKSTRGKLRYVNPILKQQHHHHSH